VDETSMRVSVDPGGPAAAAHIIDGDRVVTAAGQSVHSWDELRKIVGAHPGEAMDVTLERDGASVDTKVTPEPAGSKNEGKIRIGYYQRIVPVGVGEAAAMSLKEPAITVYNVVQGLVRVISGKEKPEFAGPVGMTKEIAKVIKIGPGPAFQFLGALSAYLGAFNLLPVPALDGGRLIFLFFEGIARRKPDAKVEAHVHLFGMMMLLCVLAVVTYFDFMPGH
jgi:regulator of sigma E protease